MGKNQESLNAYNQALKLNPNNSSALDNKGALLRDMGKN